MTSPERCKHCGEALEPNTGPPGSATGSMWRHSLTGWVWCQLKTGEPKPTEAQRDLHELQKPSGERSEFWEDESTARALLRIVIQLAEKAGLV